MTPGRLEERLRVAAALVMLGLVVELGSLTWRHPTAFIVFVLAGGALMAAGMLLFVQSLMRREDDHALVDDADRVVAGRRARGGQSAG
jgi:hypothetical protein